MECANEQHNGAQEAQGDLHATSVRCQLDVIYQRMSVSERTYSGYRAGLGDPGLVQLMSSCFGVVGSALTALFVYAKIDDSYVGAAGSEKRCCRNGEEKEGAPEGGHDGVDSSFRRTLILLRRVTFRPALATRETLVQFKVIHISFLVQPPRR